MTRFKLEIEGDFKLEFFRNDSRRAGASDSVQSRPILNGNRFSPSSRRASHLRHRARLRENAGPEPVRRLGGALPGRLPVDEGGPSRASLFTGLAVRNQAEFDVLTNQMSATRLPRATISSAACRSAASWAWESGCCRAAEIVYRDARQCRSQGAPSASISACWPAATAGSNSGPSSRLEKRNRPGSRPGNPGQVSFRVRFLQEILVKSKK